MVSIMVFSDMLKSKSTSEIQDYLEAVWKGEVVLTWQEEELLKQHLNSLKYEKPEDYIVIFLVLLAIFNIDGSKVTPITGIFKGLDSEIPQPQTFDLVWVTKRDGDVCELCEPLDGKIYGEEIGFSCPQRPAGCRFPIHCTRPVSLCQYYNTKRGGMQPCQTVVRYASGPVCRGTGRNDLPISLVTSQLHPPSSTPSAGTPTHPDRTSATVWAVTTNPALRSAGALMVGKRARAHTSSSRSSALSGRWRSGSQPVERCTPASSASSAMRDDHHGIE